MKHIFNSLLAVLLAFGGGLSADGFDREKLAAVLDAQTGEVRARYAFRHPMETLEFLGVEPGSVVIEALPGDGWYTKILVPYVGPAGKVVGADYALEMFPLFGFFTTEQLEAR